MFLTPSEADAVDARVTRVEAQTGVQVVTAVAGKSDSYPELPWTAFALAASIAAGVVVTVDAWRPDWVTGQTALTQAVAILGPAAIAALLAVFVPPFSRLFLRAARRETEVRQYAESLFLRREIFGTAGRTGILVFVSLFERRVVILPDVGLRARVKDADWDRVVSRMTEALRRNRPAEAMLAGLEEAEALLVARGFSAAAPAENVFSNRPIEESGS